MIGMSAVLASQITSPSLDADMALRSSSVLTSLFIGFLSKAAEALDGYSFGARGRSFSNCLPSTLESGRKRDHFSDCFH
jgi:hypothetical protein